MAWTRCEVYCGLLKKETTLSSIPFLVSHVLRSFLVGRIDHAARFPEALDPVDVGGDVGIPLVGIHAALVPRLDPLGLLLLVGPAKRACEKESCKS